MSFLSAISGGVWNAEDILVIPFCAFLARLGVCEMERRLAAQAMVKGSFWIRRKFMEAG